MKSFTDLEQSKKLAKILPTESADMYIGNYVGKSGKVDGTNVHYYPKGESFGGPELKESEDDTISREWLYDIKMKRVFEFSHMSNFGVYVYDKEGNCHRNTDVRPATIEEITHSERSLNKLSEFEKDEKIRKEMIEILKNEAHEFPSSVIANKSNSWIAWLEKQGEKKPQIKLVFPKFRVGDIIQHIPLEKWDTTKKIAYIDETGYHFELSHQGDTISGGCIGFSFEKDYELVEQKPAWSEEDEEYMESILDIIDRTPSLTPGKIIRHQDWLKSLKDRCSKQWKPTEGQMLAINTAINVLGKGTLSGKQLIELQEQFKKLREE